MFKIIITQSALEEYAQIGDFIAKDNLYYAHRVLQSIDETFQTLLEFPYIWKIINPTHRIIVEPQYKYKIVYKVEKNIIYIIAIFKYKADWE